MGAASSSGTSDSQENSWSERKRLSSCSSTTWPSSTSSSSSTSSLESLPDENFSNSFRCPRSPCFFFFFFRRRLLRPVTLKNQWRHAHGEWKYFVTICRRYKTFIMRMNSLVDEYLFSKECVETNINAYVNKSKGTKALWSNTVLNWITDYRIIR